MKVLVEEGMIENSEKLGAYFKTQLQAINSPVIKEVRGRGLMLAIELEAEAGGARKFCENLRASGILAKDTHGHTIRLAPPLVITKDQIDWALEKIRPVLVG